jgi:hypothetical protein
VICEESGPIILNYNALITQPESKLVAQPIVHYTMAKRPLTYSNYGKIGHAKKTCHNEKREEATILVIPTNFDEPIAKDITRPITLTRVPLRYPCSICYSFEHCTRLSLKDKSSINVPFTTTFIVINNMF